MHEGNEGTEGKAEDWAALGGVDQLAAGFAGAVREVGFVLSGAGEVAAFGLNTDVVIEEDGDADGCVGIVDGLIGVAVDAAAEGVEVAVAGVDIDAGIDVLLTTFGGLCGADAGGTKTEQDQS